MVDEQHRFGSNQRQKLEQLSAVGEKRAHFLQFSATPIPRTQAMMESAMVDISLIEGSPIKREIVTQIMTKADFPSLIEHINREISQKKQVIIVYPLVESSSFINYLSIDEAREFWEKRYRNLCITHGKDREKERILEKFREDGDILLTTTVVEVGISLPRLSTIVIVGAERLGLASLHQLRGRVARESRKGWCYLFTNLQKVPKRLEEFSKTEDGFEIARLDLLYRDSGDILDGKIQSGKKFKWLDLLIDEKIVKEAIKRV
jgi:ATP-dependent DNA helicase RecG